MFNIAIRADGGPKIGLGHLTRCLSIAHEFKDLGNYVYFISNEKNEVLIQNGFEVIRISTKNIEFKEDLYPELNKLIKILKKYKTDCLIVDHYYASEKYLTKLKNYVKILVFIDDICKISAPIDFLINYHIFVEKNSYKLWDNTKFLLGPKYTLIRKEFLNLPSRTIKENPVQIMITTGGSDNHQLTLRLLRILTRNEKTKHIQINAIIGHMFRDKKSIEDYSKNFKNIELHYNVSNMAEIMLKNDIALSSSGTTIYELAITGTPSLSFIIAKDQERIAEKMNEIKCTINLGWHNRLDDNIISEKILYLLNNFKLRIQMSNLGKKTFDGKGPYRCAKAIIYSLNEFKNDF